MGRKQRKTAPAARKDGKGAREKFLEIDSVVEELRGRLKSLLEDPEISLTVRAGLELNLLEVQIMDFTLTMILKPEKPLWTFTGREKTILKGVKAGQEDKEIANVLKLSFHTIRGCLKNIRSKTGIHSRVLLAQLPLGSLI